MFILNAIWVFYIQIHEMLILFVSDIYSLLKKRLTVDWFSTKKRMWWKQLELSECVNAFTELSQFQHSNPECKSSNHKLCSWLAAEFSSVCHSWLHTGNVNVSGKPFWSIHVLHSFSFQITWCQNVMLKRNQKRHLNTRMSALKIYSLTCIAYSFLRFPGL